MKSGKWYLIGLLATTLLFAAQASFGQGYLSSPDLADKVRPGVTTAQQVRELLGTPARTLRFPARGLEALEYDSHEYAKRVVVSISVGSDGVVRDVLKIQMSGF